MMRVATTADLPEVERITRALLPDIPPEWKPDTSTAVVVLFDGGMFVGRPDAEKRLECHAFMEKREGAIKAVREAIGLARRAGYRVKFGRRRATCLPQ